MVTALPRPEAVLYSLDMEIYEHMPRKFDKIMLLVRIEAKNIMNGLMPLPNILYSFLSVSDFFAFRGANIFDVIQISVPIRKNAAGGMTIIVHDSNEAKEIS